VDAEEDTQPDEQILSLKMTRLVVDSIKPVR